MRRFRAKRHSARGIEMPGPSSREVIAPSLEGPNRTAIEPFVPQLPDRGDPTPGRDQSGSASGKPNIRTSAGSWNLITRATGGGGGQHHGAVGSESAVRVPVVYDGGGLAVGGGRDHSPVARRAQHVRLERADAHRPAGLPFAEWRRLQGRVRAQHLFQQANIGALEGRDVAVEQRTRPRVGRFESSSGSGSNSSSRARARCRPLLTAALVVSRISAVSTAENASTSRRMRIARWRAGMCCKLAISASRSDSRLITAVAGSSPGGAIHTSGNGSSHETSPGAAGLGGRSGPS